MASGVGDTTGPVEVAVAIDGRSVLPPSPAHCVATIEPDGSAGVGWVRRSRAGWRWVDGVDAPLVEETEGYRVTIAAADGTTRAVDTGESNTVVSAAERAVGPVTLSVRQRGTQGVSLPTTLQINRGE